MPTFVRSPNKPDWGVGKVVSQSGNFWEVEFPIGRKKIHRDYLQECDLPEENQRLGASTAQVADHATSIWLTQLNKKVAKEISKGKVPFLGHYVSVLTDAHRTRFRQYLAERGSGKFDSYIQGLNRYPAAFSAFLVSELAENYGARSNHAIYRHIENAIGVEGISQAQRQDLCRAFRKAVRRLGLETASLETGQWMVAEYLRQAGLPLNQVVSAVQRILRFVRLSGLPDLDDQRVVDDWLIDFLNSPSMHNLSITVKSALQNDQSRFYLHRVFQLLDNSDHVTDRLDEEIVKALSSEASTSSIKRYAKPRFKLENWVLGVELPENPQGDWLFSEDGGGLRRHDGQSQTDFLALASLGVKQIEIEDTATKELTALTLWNDFRSNELLLFDSAGYFNNCLKFGDKEHVKPGVYYLVTLFDPKDRVEGGTINSLGFVGDREVWGYGPFSLRPGQAFSISRGPARFTLDANPENYIELQGERFRGKRGKEFIAGSNLRALISLREDVHLENLRVRFIWKSQEVQEQETTPQFEQGEECILRLEAHLANMGDGLGRLVVEVRDQGGKVLARGSELVWNGLNCYDGNGRFRCSRLPENIDYERCSNVIIAEKQKSIGAEDILSHQTFELTFKLQNSSTSILWPVPGVFVFHQTSNGDRRQIELGHDIEVETQGGDYLVITGTDPGQLRFRGFRRILNGRSGETLIPIAPLVDYPGADNEVTFCTEDGQEIRLATLSKAFDLRMFKFDRGIGGVLQVNFECGGQFDEVVLSGLDLLTGKVCELNARYLDQGDGGQQALIHPVIAGRSYRLEVKAEFVPNGAWVFTLYAARNGQRGRMCLADRRQCAFPSFKWNDQLHPSSEAVLTSLFNDLGESEVGLFRRLHEAVQQEFHNPMTSPIGRNENGGYQLPIEFEWLGSAWKTYCDRLDRSNTGYFSLLKLMEPNQYKRPQHWKPMKSVLIHALASLSRPIGEYGSLSRSGWVLMPLVRSAGLVADIRDQLDGGQVWSDIDNVLGEGSNSMRAFWLQLHRHVPSNWVNQHKPESNAALGPEHHAVARKLCGRRLEKMSLAEDKVLAPMRTVALRLAQADRSFMRPIGPGNNVYFQRPPHLNAEHDGTVRDLQSAELLVSLWAYFCRAKAHNGGQTDVNHEVWMEDVKRRLRIRFSTAQMYRAFLIALESGPELFTFHFAMWELAIRFPEN